MTPLGRNKATARRGAAVLALALLLLGGAPFPASAQQGQIQSFPEQNLEEAKQYAACMVLTKDHPQDAYDSAGAWLAKNGGPPAQHCQAVALVGLGRYTEAAQMLQTVAGELAKTDSSRTLAAQLYDQAGQVWLLEGDAAQAVAASNAALGIAPNDVEMVIDRAVALGAAERWWDALDDLNHANELAPKRADILVLRASAYRYVNSTELALADVNQALTLDPKNAEGYLERGILKDAAGDKNGARTDWVQAAQLAPNTPTAEAAQGRIEKLDLKTE
ncbi:tetratricopeptide repeat protein [Hypericibacter adhaerens]|jgi:Flp pilus assembly protein TadD|nr:tetratricopeptide repeat protein [Hypericibacter adhaerens]